MEKVKERITHYSLYVTALLKWLAVGALVGGVGGFVGALFHLGVDCATNVRLAHPWILYLLPLGGVVIALLYRLCRLEGAGTNAVIESVHFGKKIPTLLVPLIFVSTVITHLCGGSAGREGAAAASVTAPARCCAWGRRTCPWPPYAAWRACSPPSSAHP